MRILALGNSHTLSLRGVAKRPDQYGVKVDIIPTTKVHVRSTMTTIREGRGRIPFSETARLDALDFDITNYDTLVIVGMYIGGDGIFRSLTDLRCFSSVPENRLAQYHPSQLLINEYGRFVRPTFVGEASDMAGRLISVDEANAVLDHQVRYYTRLMGPATGARFPEVWWFESPMPKRSAFTTIWGDDYARSGQVARVREIYEDVVARFDQSRFGRFVRFPAEFLEGQSYLDPRYQLMPDPADIHVGVKFGEFILKTIGQ